MEPVEWLEHCFRCRRGEDKTPKDSVKKPNRSYVTVCRRAPRSASRSLILASFDIFPSSASRRGRLGSVMATTGSVYAILDKVFEERSTPKPRLYFRGRTYKWFEVWPENRGSGSVLIEDSVHSTLHHQGECAEICKRRCSLVACQPIESGFALTQNLRLTQSLMISLRSLWARLDLVP